MIDNNPVITIAARPAKAVDLNKFIDGLQSVPDDFKHRMKSLTPANYVGLAEQLVDKYFS